MLSFFMALVIGFSMAKEIAVPGLSLAVDIPDVPEGQPNPWGHTVGDETIDVRLSMFKAEAYTQVVFSGTYWQTDVDQLIEGLADQVLPMDDENLQITPFEPVAVSHPVLGPTLRLKADVIDTFMEAPRWAEVVVFPIEGATVIISALSSESAERATEVLDEALGMVKVKAPALPKDQLRLGTIQADAGYTLTLPSGMRALTLEEMRRLDSTRISGEGPFAGRLAQVTVVDTQHLARPLFTCAANSGATLEILDPAKSPVAVKNFKTMAQVLLRGGRFRFVNGTQENFFDVLLDAPVHVEGEPEIGFFSLGDRDAYTWKSKAVVFQQPMLAALFYTTYADVGLHCSIAVPQDQPERIGTFETIMKGLRIVDGEKYKPPMSVKARYIRWWRWSPYTDPLLQLYWLPIPLFLIAGWLVLKDE